MVTAAEIAGSVLLFFGLLSRFASLMLLGVVSVIQIFVYPENWRSICCKRRCCVLC